MMSVTEDHALREAELLTLRQIASAIEGTAKRLDRMHESLGDVRERLVRIESSTVDDSVTKLDAELRRALDRIDVLESNLDQQRGAGKLVMWVKEVGPWLAALALAGLAALGKIQVG